MIPLLLLFTLLHLHFCTAQSLVASPCEQRFSYVREGNDYFGQIKLDRLERGRTEIKVAFSQRDSLTSVSMSFARKVLIYILMRKTNERWCSTYTDVYQNILNENFVSMSLREQEHNLQEYKLFGSVQN